MNARSVGFCFLKACLLFFLHLFVGTFFLWLFCICYPLVGKDGYSAYYCAVCFVLVVFGVGVLYLFFRLFSKEQEKEQLVTALWYPVLLILFRCVFAHAGLFLFAEDTFTVWLCILITGVIYLLPAAVLFPLVAIVRFIWSYLRKKRAMRKENNYGNDE